jgi:hypothetical protein
MEINYFAVIVAAASTFVLGGVWYSPLMFKKAWMTASGVSEQDVNRGGASRILAGSFVLSAVMALNLAAFLSGPETTAAWGATAGALAGAGWVAVAMGVTSLFERRPIAYALVNGGYWSVAFIMMGAILGAWR